MSALMNIEVIEQGPEISMPGFWRSVGTGGTCQSPVVAALVGGFDGSTLRVCARVRASARRASNSPMRGVKRS